MEHLGIRTHFLAMLKPFIWVYGALFSMAKFHDTFRCDALW